MDIIINADDFGLSENVNATILKLHEEGILSSATLEAKSKCLEMAVEISRNNPRLGVGVHLCLDDAFNMGVDYKTIVNRETHTFFSSREIIRKLLTFSVDENELFREYSLQVEKVLDHGISVSHLDHHHHLHLYIPALRTMIRVAKKYRISYIRSQKILLHGNRNFLNSWYRNAHQFYLTRKLNTIDGYFDPRIKSESNQQTDLARIKRLLQMNKKAIEIVLHPREMNDIETSFFMTDEIKGVLKPHRIINYNDL